MRVLLWLLFILYQINVNYGDGKEKDACVVGKFLTGWKRHDFHSWRSSLSCALTLSAEYNRTFVIPDLFRLDEQKWDFNEAVEFSSLEKFHTARFITEWTFNEIIKKQLTGHYE